MKRDGALTSIWQKVAPTYKPSNKWDKNKEYDVVIAGGGITGLTTAFLLQSQGKNCVLAEANSLGFGTTGGTTAHLNTMLDSTYPEIESAFGKKEAGLVAEGAKEAIELIRQLSYIYEISCDFEYKNGYLFAQNQKEEKRLEKILEASARAGIIISYTDDLPVPMSFTKAIVFEQQAQFNIAAYLTALAELFEQKGGVILEQCVVDLPETDNTVATSLGDIKAPYLIFATHIPPSVNILHFRCAPYRSYAAAVTLATDNYPDALVYDMEEPYHYFRTHRLNNKPYLIAGGFDHKTGHIENTEEVFRSLHSYLNQYYEVKSINFQWSSQYYVSTDGLPYIGKLPGRENVFTATGFNGNGMIFGTLSAKILSDRLLGKENKYTELFSPSRIKPIAGFTAFIQENADVVHQFISKRFNYEEIDALVQLANEEAKLVEYEGKRMALYKDDKGIIHALDPVCPHAGCIVVWNSAEKTWDCPCHGARYGIDGNFLTAPALKGLKKLNIEEL